MPLHQDKLGGAWALLFLQKESLEKELKETAESEGHTYIRDLTVGKLKYDHKRGECLSRSNLSNTESGEERLDAAHPSLAAQAERESFSARGVGKNDDFSSDFVRKLKQSPHIQSYATQALGRASLSSKPRAQQKKHVFKEQVLGQLLSRLKKPETFPVENLFSLMDSIPALIVDAKDFQLNIIRVVQSSDGFRGIAKWTFEILGSLFKRFHAIYEEKKEAYSGALQSNSSEKSEKKARLDALTAFTTKYKNAACQYEQIITRLSVFCLMCRLFEFKVSLSEEMCDSYALAYETAKLHSKMFSTMVLAMGVPVQASLPSTKEEGAAAAASAVASAAEVGPAASGNPSHVFYESTGVTASVKASLAPAEEEFSANP